ncbi:MAG: hypothetical protein IAF94_26365 [Pirellulaceae bacterium]|nr:hypothetical protein [Pirellulaceae bacterium]
MPAALFALSVTKPLIEKMARKLLKKYQGDGIIKDALGDLLPEEGNLVDGLTQLIKEKKLDDVLKNITEPDELTGTIIEGITERIRDLQKDSGERLKPDGILGRMTLKWIRDRKSCGMVENEHLSLATAPAPKTENGRKVVLYFIEKDQSGYKLPHLTDFPLPGSAFYFLKIAIGSWVGYLNLEANITDIRENANLVITTDSLPPGSPDNWIALTSVGPPSGQQLLLTFDKTETWSSKVFQACTAHEFGHALGIRHRNVQQPNQLMNDTLSDILTPQGFDIQFAQSIWGKRA